MIDRRRKPAAERLRAAWRVAGWCGVGCVILLSLAPVPPEAVEAGGGDKWLHFAGYAVLAAWFGQLHRGAARWGVFAGLVMLGFGLEALQGLVPWRSAEGWDGLADAAGAAAGLLLILAPGGNVLERLTGARSVPE